MNDFLRSADSRETSKAIMDAIWWLALEMEDEAARIWSEPTQDEMIAIWERVTQNGMIDSKNFCWGESGENWAFYVELPIGIAP